MRREHIRQELPQLLLEHTNAEGPVFLCVYASQPAVPSCQSRVTRPEDSRADHLLLLRCPNLLLNGTLGSVCPRAAPLPVQMTAVASYQLCLRFLLLTAD